MGPESPRLQTAAELEGSAEGQAHDPQGSVRARISDAMVGIKKELYGKGPTGAKTYLNDAYVFVVLEGGLTRNEQTMLAGGEDDLVRTFRLRFQAIVAETATKAIEEITGRRVLTYHSQIVFDPVRAFEIIVLDEPPSSGA